MIGSLAIGLAWASLIFLCRIAWTDFMTLRIRNKDVLILMGVAVLLWLARSGGRDWVDLLAGVFLFGMGFLFWALRMMGAGDAKLFLPLGVMIGWSGLFVFAVALLPASLLTLALFFMMRWLLPQTGTLGGRVAQIARLRGVPYAVPLFLATVPAMLPQLGLM